MQSLVTAEEVDEQMLQRMVSIGLWCIQDEPSLRPSMKKVVLMLEDLIETTIPPIPASLVVLQQHLFLPFLLLLVVLHGLRDHFLLLLVVLCS